MSSLLFFQTLRWATLGAWALVALRLTLPALRAFTPRRRYLDFLWLCIWGTATNRLWHWSNDHSFGAVVDPFSASDGPAWYLSAILVAIGFQCARSWYADGPVPKGCA